MFNLNSDPNFLHHYIIGVVKNEEDKKMFLKYGPAYYSYEDIQNIKKALTLRGDKIYTDIYKMSATEIYNMFHCSASIMSLISFKIIYQEKLATVHYFTYKDKISDPSDFFTTYVERANDNKLEREGLQNSNIGDSQ